MNKFLIQLINGKPIWDYADKIEDEDVAFCTIDEMSDMNFGVDSDAIRDYIPVGTFEFVAEYCKLFVDDSVTCEIDVVRSMAKDNHHQYIIK